MVGFYQKFIDNAQYYLSPFYDLKAKNANHNKITQSLRFLASFEMLKQCIANAFLDMEPSPKL